MNFAAIKYCDIANGEGVRTSLFVSGCRRGCPECFNPETWSFTAGEPFTGETAEQILESLDQPFVAGLTVLGGEPMEPENQSGLVGFLESVRARFPIGGPETIWCYTGDTLEELQEGGPHRTDVTDRVLACLDVLVDGPYERELHDITLRFRGSSNQRIIDMIRTRDQGRVVLWEDDRLYASHTM
ncbi:ribonucleoside-triphosphate reductase class III activase subunit [Coriobacterium glomerans PW2]|uniref:Anaerobic ribonucleoside-triphosphate reductase-activating protein n=1 Tax=Coriobacterium glomerans (strain ATCC 49209 / DSM 20642 / JCM 10262 / PW2) TaxID=700015 RepID=F2N7H7_CORGP|nr:anaerobic ribonucleoside-triphosphate reductase activating protein [Coriobacterium glomerans]AEB06793.1 ribonucleoside-triphosphate reductase class III activase subunit [Coriobacterium glomerans PW2]